MENILFYKYVEIEDVDKLRKELLQFCNANGLKGKILLSKEGINGNLTGDENQTQVFMDHIVKDDRFADLQFKRGKTSGHNFKRMIVKPRKEIITSGLEVDLSNRGKYLEPHELKEKLEKGEDIVIIDARNDYEYEVGRFKGALDLRMKEFTEWKDAVKKIEHLKNKTVVTYCTGGVRCEKASAYLVEQGFEDVYQLHGGIIRYGEEVGDEFWEGKCFVFDRRGAIEIDKAKQEEPESQCVLCFIPIDTKENCKHCSEEFIVCDKCIELLEGCCSKMCRNTIRLKEGRPLKKKYEITA